MVLSDLLMRNVRNNPHKTAVVCRETQTSLSYREFNDRVNSLLNGFHDLGVKKGDRVAVLYHNCHCYTELFFALAKGGIVIVPIDFRLKGKEISFLINNSGAVAAITGGEYLEALPPPADIPTVRKIICIGKASPGMVGYEDLIASHSSLEPQVDVKENDLATLYHTSGTTGVPKGVMMTHKNLISIATNTLIAFRVNHDDITLHTSPFSHAAPIWPLMIHFYMGGSNVLLKKFTPKAVFETIEQERITTWNSVPVMLIQLLNYPDSRCYDLSSLRWISYGAAPMPVEILKKALARFGPIFIQVYGLTEAYPVTLLPREDHILGATEEKMKRLGSCGKELINCEVRVVNEAGDNVAPGEKGEIITRGDHVMEGYWSLPEETSAAIRNGWLHTGDLATVDAEGYIYIVDRKKEIIITGGENVSPREVEEVIYMHPAVAEAAVIGVPDEKWGEMIKALVVLKEGKKAAAEEIMDLCRNNLAGFKKPKAIEFLDSLPHTPSGKVLKRELRERYWKQ
ncbi:MAG: long-chain-fatty-acid--CoA ligase [Syntrophales bacterium]|nr:long-chain-fatty-acid--CoA ligase [Syntrophales bacterium]